MKSAANAVCICLLVLLVVLLLAPPSGGWYWWRHGVTPVPAPVVPVPAPVVPLPVPVPVRPRPCPGPGPCPREDLVGKPVVDGPSHDGKEVQCDLPVDLRQHNVGGRDGAGLCVFTSIMHSARYQNERRLWNFQADMRKEPGGGYPAKVDAMVKKYGAGTQYIQYEGRDPSILELSLKCGKMPGVTYNGMDQVHYSGRIAHMVSLVYLDSTAACILDNNFVGERDLVWMTRDDFLQRWTGGGSGWAVILLSGRPPPVPHN